LTYNQAYAIIHFMEQHPKQNQNTVMYYATVNQKLRFPLSFTVGNTTVDVIKEAAGFYQV